MKGWKIGWEEGLESKEGKIQAEDGGTLYYHMQRDCTTLITDIIEIGRASCRERV